MSTRFFVYLVTDLEPISALSKVERELELCRNDQEKEPAIPAITLGGDKAPENPIEFINDALESKVTQ